MTSEHMLPKPDLLLGRVGEVGDNRETEIQELLSRHSDLITDNIANQIAMREAKRAREEYLKSRLEGHANDNISKAPGITIYVTDEAKAVLTSKFEQALYPVPKQAWKPIANGVWEISFAKGIYQMGFGGCQFYQEADDDYFKGGSGNARLPFVARYDDVIRVEGDSGELWQNVNYSWDGTPKSQ